MSLTQKLRRTLRPAGKTAQAILRWKRFSPHDAPPIFGNSKPKNLYFDQLFFRRLWLPE